MVPRNQLAQAFALINPSRELAVLTGPALAGLFIALHGPGLMYLADAATYAVLAVVLGLLRVPRLMPSRHPPVLHSIAEGARFVAKRPTIWMMMSLDLSATLFGAYRVVLPALTLNVLHAGPAAYGLLSSAPSAGALLATWPVVHLVGRPGRTGRILLGAAAGYGVATLFLAQSRWLLLALLAGLLVGAFDALATTIRQAAVQLETPDEMRGRVSSIYQMASRGGPALGDTIIGGVASLLGPVSALSLGSIAPIGYAAALWVRRSRLRDYRTVEEPAPAVTSP
jgi:hypothetical protein